MLMTGHSRRSPGRRRLLQHLGATGLSLGTGLQAAEPAPLVAAFIENFAPFVMEDERGILVDLVREAARRLGRNLRKLDFPSLRLDLDPLDKYPKLDIFVATPAARRPSYHYTPLYAFENVAASLTDRGLRIDSVEDLAGKSIAAFYHASKHLKEPFTTFHSRVLASARNYQELERMESIVSMLLARRVQVVLLDRTFVRYYARKLGRPDLAGITVHEIFPQRNNIYAVGKNAQLIAQMRKHLDEMERGGWTATMLKTYL